MFMQLGSKGISTIIGMIIFLIIMSMFVSLCIVILDRFTYMVKQVAVHMESIDEARRVIDAIYSYWRYNTTHIEIYIDNKATRGVMVIAIAVIFNDSSFITFSKSSTSDIGHVNDMFRLIVYIDEKYMVREQVLPFIIPPVHKTKVIVKLPEANYIVPIAISISIEVPPIITSISSHYLGLLK